MAKEVQRFTQRDILISLYENGMRTNYLLLAVLGAIVGRPFVMSPPHIVASFLLALASVAFALIVMARARRLVNGRLKLAIAIVGIAQVFALAAEYVPFSPSDAVAGLRFAFSGLLIWWSLSVPLVDHDKLLVDG